MAKETENTLLRNEEAERLEAKSQEIIRKLDKESATRKFTNPLMKKIFFAPFWQNSSEWKKLLQGFQKRQTVICLKKSELAWKK